MLVFFLEPPPMTFDLFELLGEYPLTFLGSLLLIFNNTQVRLHKSFTDRKGSAPSLGLI